MANKKICTCEVCGKEFEGYPSSRYCLNCKPAVDRETKRRSLAKFRAAEAKAKAAALAKELEEDAERQTKEFVPNTKQCKKGCEYWRFMSGLNCNGCHYLHDTGKRVQKDADGKCLCYTPENKKKRKAWDMPATSASTLSGYKTSGYKT